jgi:hypothetical protein
MSRHKKRSRKWMREEAVLVKMEYRHVIQEVILPKSAVGAIIWTDRAGQRHIGALRASTTSIGALLVIHPAIVVFTV